MKYEISEEGPSWSRMANKTYTITKKGIGWYVSYKIKIVSNKIEQAFSLKAVATEGSFKNSKLTKLSNKKAQWKAKYKLGVTRVVSCNAIVNGKKLVVS
ncbi:DUF5626 family protein [Ligilactobacillus pabuli]|nr:DUF5626 family protein [Ligilactobacillus pabuli]